MSEDQDAPHAKSLVPGVHRIIRVLRTDEGPYRGVLVAQEGGVAVSAELRDFDDWPGWEYGGSSHVAAAVDILRRPDGMEVLLPWCTERLPVFIARRQALGEALAPGEVVTIAVSMLRGLGELGRQEEDPAGEWWLSDEGRPLFVHGPGGGARRSAGDIVGSLAEAEADRALRRALGSLREQLREPRLHPDDLRRGEDEMLLLAAPRPLRTGVTEPEPLPGIRQRVAVRVERRERIRAPRGILGGARSLLHAITEALSGGIERRRERRARNGAADVRTDAPRRNPRTRSILVAAGAAVIVLGAGLLWPQGDGDAADAVAGNTVTDAPAATGAGAADGAVRNTDDPFSDAAAPSEDPAPPPSSASEEAETVAEDPAIAAEDLLARIGRCDEQGDERCEDALAEGTALPREGAVREEPEARTVALVDEYGDVAVVSVSRMGAERAAQMLVLVRLNDRWLVRDVYDVADQPA